MFLSSKIESLTKWAVRGQSSWTDLLGPFFQVHEVHVVTELKGSVNDAGLIPEQNRGLLAKMGKYAVEKKSAIMSLS